MPDPSPTSSLLDNLKLPLKERLAWVLEMMREMSSYTDPQQMVQAYGRRMRKVMPSDAWLSLSRRELVQPWYRITRSVLHDDSINPWKDRDKLPLLDRGLLGELIYGNEPVILGDLKVPADDPAGRYLDGMRSLTAIPMFDAGIAQNMVVLLSRQPNHFNPERLPEHVWISNLFGRATQNLVLSEEVKQAYDEVDRELTSVAEIQRSLLPLELPRIDGLQFACHYQTSRQAGGDYYDFFPLKDGRWGIFIADVSGHGTPAAVLMAVTHSIAHAMPGAPDPPSALLRFVNHHLTARYTNNRAFVTAFYGIYDPEKRTINYSRAGHCPPRIKRAGDDTLREMDQAAHLPLGISADEKYEDFSEQLDVGDLLVFYTDGITEARSLSGELFGLDRLDRVLQCGSCTVDGLLNDTIKAVEEFSAHRAVNDDRTLLIAKVS